MREAVSAAGMGGLTVEVPAVPAVGIIVRRLRLALRLLGEPLDARELDG